MRWELTHNNLILTLKDATAIEIEQLEISLKRRIESWKWHPKVVKGYWDGYISYFKNNTFAPSGLWKEIIDIGKTFGMEVQIDGLKNLFDRSVVYEDFVTWANKLFENHPSIDLREYQIESAYNIIKYKSSLSELATSAGKTVIVYLVIMHLLETQKAKRILMIVPTVDLVLQGHEDFFDYHETSGSSVKLMIQQIYAGQKIKPESNIVIGTYQSLVKKKSDYFKDFDAVIVDETHKAKAASIQTILGKCSCDRRFGLTGTLPKKHTVDYLTIMAYTGPVITNVRADYLINEGYITPCEVKCIEMGYASVDVREAFKNLTKTEEDRKRLLKLEQDFMLQSRRRLEFITDIILKAKQNSLVLFYRIEYGKAIYDMLRQKSERNVYYIDGNTDKDLRELYKHEMEDGEGKILVASFGTFSTGINIKNIHFVYLTESFKSEIIIRQSIGRGLRKHNTKLKLVIVDFVDDYRLPQFQNYLYRHGLKRREIYAEQNFPYKVYSVDLIKLYPTVEESS